MKKPIEKTNILKKPIDTDILKKPPIGTDILKNTAETENVKKHVKNNIKSRNSVKSHGDPVNGFNNSNEHSAPSSHQNKNDYFMDVLDITKETCSFCKKDIKNDRELVDCRICLHGGNDVISGVITIEISK